MSGQVWAVNTSGNYMYADELSDVLRMAVQPLVKFRQFCDAKDFTQKGLNKGEAFHWNIYSDIATQGTTLTETTTMPESQFTISQGTGTVTEYGNSVPYTGKLDALSKQPVTEIINKVLKNDCKKAFDTDAYNEFNTTLLRVVPSAGTSTTAITLTTNGTAGSTNTGVAFSKQHQRAIVVSMKERNIPPYEGDDYFAVGHPSTWDNLAQNLEGVYQYTTEGLADIRNGEIGRFNSMRFIEQTNIAKASWGGGLTNWAFFFGEDTVAEAMCVPEELRGKIPTDYGRSKGIAWYYLGGFKIVHTQAAQTRIYKWDST